METLEAARKAMGIGKIEMAKELGVSYPTYDKIEHDPSTASVKQAQEIIKILSRGFEPLFFDRNYRKTTVAELDN